MDKMATIIRLSPDMQLGHIPSKKNKKYLMLMRAPMVMVACADTLQELDGVLHEKNIKFDAENVVLYEIPAEVDPKGIVDELGDHLDRYFGMKGDRYRWGSN